MNAAQDEKTKGVFGRFVDRLIKYSDDFANFFGGIFVLSIGFIVFAIGSYFYTKLLTDNFQESLLNKNLLYFWVSLIAAASIGIITYILMLFFARRVRVAEENAKIETHKHFYYEISKWSIETLIAANVGKDITDFLERFRKRKVLRMSIPLNTDSGETDWLGELKARFGENRVGDFEKDILKYTQRKVEKPVEKIEDAEKDNP